MKVKFGEPEHGWVELILTDEDFILTDDISDVPNDFIANFVTSLSRLLTYENQQIVELSLEPAYYIFTLNRSENDFSLSVERTESITNDGLLLALSGSFEEVILPFYRAIKEFYSHDYQEPNWPEGNQKEIAHLVELIKQYKQKN